MSDLNDLLYTLTGIGMGLHNDMRQARTYLSISPADQAILVLNFGSEALGHERAYQHRTVKAARRIA